MSVAEILDRARAQGVMIATAESCTGGMVAVALTDVPGSSAVVERSFVTYSNQAKIEMLGVSTDTLAAFGAVSEEIARRWPTGPCATAVPILPCRSPASPVPAGQSTSPKAVSALAWRGTGHATVTETQDFGAQGREAVRRLSRDHALELLQDALSRGPV